MKACAQRCTGDLHMCLRHHRSYCPKSGNNQNVSHWTWIAKLQDWQSPRRHSSAIPVTVYQVSWGGGDGTQETQQLCRYLWQSTQVSWGGGDDTQETQLCRYLWQSTRSAKVKEMATPPRRWKTELDFVNPRMSWAPASIVREDRQWPAGPHSCYLTCPNVVECTFKLNQNKPFLPQAASSSLCHSDKKAMNSLDRWPKQMCYVIVWTNWQRRRNKTLIHIPYLPSPSLYLAPFSPSPPFHKVSSSAHCALSIMMPCLAWPKRQGASETLNQN